MNRLIEKYQSLSPVVKAPIWYTICSVIQNGIGFFTMPIFTNLMTTEQYGLFSIYQSWMGILVIFTTLNLQYGVFNNAMIKYQERRDEYISAMQGLVLVLNAGFLIIYLLFRKQLNVLFGLSTVIMLAMFLEMAMTPALGLWSGKKRFEYRYREVIGITLLMSFANPVIGVAAVMMTEDKGVTKILASAVVNSAFCFLIFVRNLWRGKKLYVKEYWKYAVSFNLPLIPYYLSQIVFNQSDRIMINSMVGTDKAAIYSVVYNCSTVITFAINAINNAFVPWTYERLNDKDYKSLGKVSNALSVFIGAILLMVMLVAPEIIAIMAADEYYEGIWTMPPIICSLYFLFQAQLFINVEFFEEKKNYLVWGSVFGAVLNIVLNYLLIPVFGYVVAGYTTLAAYIVFALANYFFMKKICVQKKTSIYDIRSLTIFSVFMVAATIVIVFSYHSFWVRMGLVGVIVLLGIVFRKKLLEIVNSIQKK
mgnify:CR=1 FL=1